MIDVAIGIDIGGTNTVFGLVDKAGNCLDRKNILTTNFETPDALVSKIFKEIQKMVSSSENLNIIGIGVGAPNGNYYNGTIEHAPNLNWKGVINLTKLFRNYFDHPVYVTNDANAAAIGEMTYGVAKGIDDFIVVTLGTGLGSGIVCNGKLVYGHDGFAGELGHTIVEENGRECGCGRKGCLETYVSATGLVRTAKIMLASTSQESKLRAFSGKELTAKIISEAALKGDIKALEIFDFTARKLGVSLANTIAITSPKMIVLSGGLAKSEELLTQSTKKYMEENVNHVFKDKVELICSNFNESDISILGASALVWNELTKEHFNAVKLN